MKSFCLWLLKIYLHLHERFHERVFHTLAIRAFGGLHPKNVFHYRSEFFRQNVSANDVVIDVACGSGKILGEIAPLIKKGIGLDYDERNIERGRRHFSAGNLEFRRIDVLDFSYAKFRTEVPYTKAIFSHILEHIENVPALLKEVSALSVLICVPSQENWYRQTLKHLGLRYTSDPTHFREYTREMLAADLAASGYRVDSMGFNAEGEIICCASLVR